MENTLRIGRILFGVPWLIFGLQHFLYASFVATLVPAYMPLRLGWAYFTGAAMIAAGASLIVNKKASLAAFLLGIMMLLFIVMIHIPKLAENVSVVMTWTRALQDVIIAAAAFILAENLATRKVKNGILKAFAGISRYIFALVLIVFSVHQFGDLDFQSAKVPAYLPMRIVWVYFVGIAMLVTGISVLINKKSKVAATLLGIILLAVNLLLHVPLLVSDVNAPLFWTSAMLDLAVTGGVFILAGSLSDKWNSDD